MFIVELCCKNIAELMFLETSALTGENVEETFLKCARTILTKVESGKVCVSLKIFVASFYVLCMRETYYTFREKFTNFITLFFLEGVV